MRINDRAHEQHSNHYDDRFNQIYRIRPGMNHIRQSLEDIAGAPDNRTMDMDNIRRLMLFTSDLRQPGSLCLSNLRLTKQGEATADLD
jgi:hypothetical protein